MTAASLQTSSRPALASEARHIMGQAFYGSGQDTGGQPMSVRRTRVTRRNPDLALTYGGHSGHIARLYLHATPASQVHQGQRSFIIPPRVAMETSFRDVHDLCAWPVAHRVDQIAFDLPTAALAQWSEDHAFANGVLRDIASGLSVTDPVLQAFGLAAIPVLRQPSAFHRFFIDHILDGVCTYLFQGLAPARALCQGGLAPWQERRAKEMMEASIASALSLEEVARACGLSAAHFGRAFRQTCGTTPYKWLVSRRIERARHMLRATDTPLALVATACGFTDQAHFSNVFSRVTGSPPGIFRRYWMRR